MTVSDTRRLLLRVNMSIHLAMSCITGVLNQAAEHADVGQARMGRDLKDLAKVKEYLVDNNPFRFCDADNLVSLMSGVVAVPSDSVTCDVAKEAGSKINVILSLLYYKEVCRLGVSV